MFLNLLEGSNASNPNQWVSWVLIGVLVVAMVVVMFFMNRRSKKQRQEAEDMINAVKPGNKVKTIGGVCGIVVEVDPEENTFVLETGSESTGKCYMKFDRQAILMSDAVADKTAAPASTGEPFEEQPSEAASEPAETAESGEEAKDAEKNDKEEKSE